MEAKEGVTKKKRPLIATVAKVLAWILGSLVFLVLLVLVLIQTSFVQNFARKKVVGYLEGKLKTKVEIGKLDVSFPTTLSLQNVFFEDQSKDTLLYGKEIKVNIDMFRLIRKDIEIKEISLNGIVAEVKRLQPDSVFNFQFIVDAFSSSTAAAPASSHDTSALKMNIGRVLVNNTRIVYKDIFTGNDMDLTFGHFDTKIYTFDPAHLSFDFPSITLKGLRGYFYQVEPLKKPLEKTVAEAAAAPEHVLRFLNKEITLSDIHVVYRSQSSHISSSFDIGNASIHPKTIDLKNSVIALKDAAIYNSSIAIVTASKEADKKPKDTALDAAPTPSMKVTSGDITVKNLDLKYDDRSAPVAPSGMDYAHLGLQHLSLKASGVEYSTDTLIATVTSASMKEKSGFVLNNFRGDFRMVPTGVSVKNLLIETPGSRIRNNAVVSYPSVAAIKTDPGSIGLDIELQNSKLTMNDLWTFVPQLKNRTSSLAPGSTLFADAIIKGKVSDLHFQKLILRGLTTTDINVTGVVKGFPDTRKISADLTIHKFQSSAQDILGFLPENSLPQQISLPQALSSSGRIIGNMNHLYADLTVNSTSGNAKITGTLENITDKNKARYDVILSAGNLQLGRILKNPQLGPLTATFKAKGNGGYDPGTARAAFNGIISNVTLNHYNYHNIRASGGIAQKKYQLNAAVHDPNVDATVSASGVFSGKYPGILLKASIDSIKTLPLHLTAGPVTYHGQIAAGFSDIDPDHLKGHLNITHSILVNNGQRITVDSLQLTADDSPGYQSLGIKTDFLSAALNGRYKLTELADVLRQSIDPYFSVTNRKDTVRVAPYHFSVTATVMNNAALHAFLPQVAVLKTVTFRGNFASDSGWNMYLKSPHMVYGNMVIDSLGFMAYTKNNSLIFNFSLQKFQMGTTFNMYATALAGTLKNNDVDFVLSIRDRQSKNKYRLGGNLNHLSFNEYIFSLNPDNLLLNYDKWAVTADNKIIYSPNHLHAHNFILSQSGQQFGLNSTGSGSNDQLEVNFTNFKIETLTGFIQNDSVMVNGLLNGKAMIKNIGAQPTFTTDITASDLSVYKDTLGNLTARVNNNVANTYHADISLNGRGNNVKITGDYNVKPTNSSYDFVLDLVSLQMKSLEGFTKGALKDTRGYLFGRVAFNGSLNSPNIDGKIHFSNTAFNVRTLNNVFKVDKEAIAIINNRGILFNTFTIRDTAGNAIVIDGELDTPDFYNYTFNLKINARNFQAINSTNKDNQLFYGKMVFSTNLSIKGTPSHPVVDGNLTVNDKTDFTVVLPQNDPGIEKREGIVRFVDRSATAEDSLFMKPYDSLKQTSFQGYDVSLNITISKEAVFNMIVDAGNGDFLRLKGAGQLTGGIDASGKITVVGSYEIDDGTYNLTFNFLKRKFNIQKGSRIVWTGEPTTAQIDVTAIYMANTAPIDLVENQVESTNQTIYKQKLPFEVHLLLQGELLKPQITFDIILPKDKNYNVSDVIISTVQTKLAQMRQQPAEMNKQVFALLLLNRFIGEDPFSSSGGSTNAGFFAMQSVSRLLSEQLNQLAQNLVQGVDINLDLATTQDYTTGSEQNRTDLTVGISKRLLSDRLTVSVGSDFELQGPMQTNQQQNNLAGNISVNYKLSKDGRYMLRAYRKNDYTGEIEGYVIETGIGFIISVDYNKFKQLFTTQEQRKKKREIRQENKAVKKADNAKKESEQTITPPSKANDNGQ